MNIDYEVIEKFCRLNMNVKRDIPIRSSEMGVLIYISNKSDIVTPLDISNFLGVTKPSVTPIVNTLINDGYLNKIPSMIDKRSYNLSLTSKAQDLLKLSLEKYIASINILKDGLGDADYKLLIELLDKSNEILRKGNY